MAQYLLDTNHVSALLAGEHKLRTRLAQRIGKKDSFGISPTVLGELYFAAYASSRREKNLSALRDFIKQVTLWPFAEKEAEEFGRIQAEQKADGVPVPPTDVQIAAVARVRNVTVLTHDRHFSSIKRLSVENWLV